MISFSRSQGTYQHAAPGLSYVRCCACTFSLAFHNALLCTSMQ